VQRTLRSVRAAIRRALPGAEEGISYRIPVFKLGGRPVIYFAGWKEHYSLYPATGPVRAALKDELAPYDLSKGTIRFPLSEPVPVKLVGRIARLRAKEVAEGEKPRSAVTKKR
jgi:uncharacterized protein YdhG (YjbR/CyaY superfamily)